MYFFDCARRSRIKEQADGVKHSGSSTALVGSERQENSNSMDPGMISGESR